MSERSERTTCILYLYILVVSCPDPPSGGCGERPHPPEGGSGYENSNQAKNFTFKQNVYFSPANVICKVGRYATNVIIMHVM